MQSVIKDIVLVKPRGFCAGVDRAIEIVELAIQIYKNDIYVRHEIVHNHHVVNNFKKQGVKFIEDINEVPENAILIFSAHGTSPQVIKIAQEKNIKFIDAVCPLVTKVHIEILSAMKLNKKILYIGHRDHQEVLSSMGYSTANYDIGCSKTKDEQFNSDQSIYLIENLKDVVELKQNIGDLPCTVLTQTTLSIDETEEIINEIKHHFSEVKLPNSGDICYATQNRQNAIKELAKVVDYILIIGSNNSSNTNRLVELARNLGTDCDLVPDPSIFSLDKKYYGKTIGISAGASAPEFLVEELVLKLTNDESQVRTLHAITESVSFPIQEELLKF